MEIDDVGAIKKLRVRIPDGRGERSDWFLETIKLHNLDTGDVAMFKANCWLGARGDGQPYVDLPAIIKSKPQLKSKYNLPYGIIYATCSNQWVLCLLIIDYKRHDCVSQL